MLLAGVVANVFVCADVITTVFFMAGVIAMVADGIATLVG